MRQFMRILGLISRQEERRKQRRRWLTVIGIILLLWMVVGLWVAVALFQFFGSKDLVSVYVGSDLRDVLFLYSEVT